MKMRRCILGAIALLLTLAWGGDILADDAGRETPIVSLGAGGRGLGLGGAYSALATDASAMHYNPGGLADLAHQEFSFMHSVLFEGTAYNYASWVYPITENHGVGGAIMRLGTDDIIRRVDFTDQGRFDYSHTQMMLAYGRDVGQVVSFGTAVKIVTSRSTLIQILEWG